MSKVVSVDPAVKKERKGCWRVSRRGFLIGVGVTGAVAAGGLYFGLPLAQTQIAGFLDNASAPFGVEATPNTWFEIAADENDPTKSIVILHTPKVEMGQGIHTALAQISAEELEVEFGQMRVVSAKSDRGMSDNSGTGGSSSVSSLWVSLREAGATMREMLREQAATKLGVAGSELSAESGIFTHAASGKTLAYHEAAAGVTDWVIPEEAPALKPRSEFKVIGKPMPRVDFEAKLKGQAIYGLDARLPGMLYGAVARPSMIGGKLKSAAVGDAASQPGFIQAVFEDDFAGVVAETRIEADLARNKLAVEWEGDLSLQQADIDAMITVGEGKAVVVQKEGDTKKAFADRDDAIVGEYRTPFAAHAHLEPQSTLVDVRDDGVDVYASTQMPSALRSAVADALDVDVETVNVQATYLGGGFGRKLNSSDAVEAAILSRATGKPVHVGWNRREEFRNGYLRPGTHHLLRGTLDDGGLIAAIEHNTASDDVAFPFFPSAAAALMGVDFGAWRGGTVQYGAIPNRQTVAWRTQTPLATGWWRGLGLLANTFALESFIDELAHAAGADPVAFRVAQFNDDEHNVRLRSVVEVAAEKANWGGALAEGHAQGVAVSLDVNTPVAQVVDVSIDGDKIRVHKVTSVIDPGVIINPDGVSAQSQGSIIMGLSSTFFEKITVKDGKIEASNFNRYPLITMKEAPEIDIVQLSTGDAPRGVGEPPIGPIAAAVGNAVFALTGQRLRELPLKLG